MIFCLQFWESNIKPHVVIFVLLPVMILLIILPTTTYGGFTPEIKCKGPHTRFNLVARDRYMPLSCVVYGSKLLSCSLTAKVAGKLRHCLFQATSGVKDQRHQNFVTSHSAILPSKINYRCRAWLRVCPSIRDRSVPERLWLHSNELMSLWMI